MRRLLKWLGYLLGSVIVLALCGLAAVYAISEYQLRRTFPLPPVSLSVPDDAGSIAEGGRLARLRGCYMGCHRELEGGIFVDEPLLARLVAPNLTQAIARYGEEGFARIVRFGIRPDGSSTTGMPSDMFYFLSDADLAKIVAFVRNAQRVETNHPESAYRLLARVGLTLGEFEPDAARVAKLGPRPPAPRSGPTPAYGEYLARTVCTECHGMRLEGDEFFPSPPLTIARGYSREQFGRLLTEGVPIGDRELGVMGKVAQYRFSVLTESEIDALFAFLQTATLPLAEGTSRPVVTDEDI